MKNFFIVLLLLSPLFGGCDDDKQPRIETWTIASEKGVDRIGMGYGYVPAYIVKTEANAEWKTVAGSIGDFVFKKGYQSEILVRTEPIPDPPADGSSVRHTMIRLISHTPADPPVDPKSFSPELEIIVASERGDNRMTAYWFKDVRYTDPHWQAFPWEIEGFDFTPGYECRLRIQPVAEYDDAKSDYEVKYYQTKLISRERKDSEGLPER